MGWGNIFAPGVPSTDTDAQFTKRLALEDVNEVELDLAEMGERRRKYGKGQLDPSADTYIVPEPGFF